MSTARNLVTLPKFVILAILGAILGLFAFLMFTSGEASAAFPYPYYLYAPGGGMCTDIGTWDEPTLTCTLTGDADSEVRLQSPGITLDGAGFKVTGPPTGYAGVEVRATDTTVKNTVIWGNQYGILGSNWINVTIENNTITGNSVGIRFAASTTGTTGNIINGNTITVPSYGIVNYYHDALTITNNTITSDYAGILLGGIKILPHIFCPTNPTYCSENHVVTGNTITLTGTNAIAALWIQQSDGSTITGNDFSGQRDSATTWGAIAFHDADNNTVYNNNFHNNTNQVGSDSLSTGNIFSQPAPTGGNWWDTYDAPGAPEFCENTNPVDNFCDDPLTLPGGIGTDDLPWTSAFSIGGPPAPPAEGHWKFDEGSGTTALDSANGFDGTLTNGAGYTTATIDGSPSALLLDGSDDFVNYGDVLDAGTSDLTVSVCYNASRAGVTQVLLVKGLTGGRDGYELLLHANQLVFDLQGTGVSFFNTTVAEPAANQWHHVAGVLDRTANTATLYLDGQAVASSNVTGIGNLDNTVSLGIGALNRQGASGPTVQFFQGSIDEGRVKLAALSAAEIAELAEPCVQPDEPPTLNLPADITGVEATGPGGATVNFNATATDDEDGPLTPSCSPASGAPFALGTTPVDCSVTDSGNNTVDGSFNITVVDTTAPVVTAPTSKDRGTRYLRGSR